VTTAAAGLAAAGPACVPALIASAAATCWDRLGRRAGELIWLVDEPESWGAGFRAPNAAFGTRTPTGRAHL